MTSAMDGNRGSHGPMILENTEKRDALVAIERKYQDLWAKNRIFEVDTPTCSAHPLDSSDARDLQARFPKFYGRMAYPYVNGIPHLGHAYTVSKIDFAARVARAKGKRTLYPQGYHGTGMPIKACADKLVREISLFGKNFEGYSEDDDGVTVKHESETPSPDGTSPKEDVTRFSNTKKSKAALKTVKAKYQFQVMLALGIDRSEIHKFADAQYWLEFFPQLWEKHLTDFGCGIDWRRGFITTDANPYYDSFIRWQIQRLRDMGKLRFGKRYTVYSPKDGQPCLDHDRASGEAVQVQEYLALKCKVVRWSDKAQRVLQAAADLIPNDAAIYMIPATLRPETINGVTNIFVSPTITYGIYQLSESEYFFLTDRVARNMSFQGIFAGWGSARKVMEMSGADAMGSKVHVPLSWKGEVYVLPMATIKETNGTGVVTSVPSDSPEDYAMTRELSRKAQFYQIDPAWVCLYIVPIIETPDYGNAIALTLVEKLQIKSPREEQKLAEAKEVAYKAGFYQGKLIYGDLKGKTVQEAKPLIKQQLLEKGQAFDYCEPDGQVISRSGDDCVAAYLDQWYLTYGNVDETWRQATLRHLRDEDGQGFNSFGNGTKHALEQTLGWMSEWSVSRQYGLGTKLPWDPTQLVEGLSDSTIYMAYYTIAHYLHSDIFGRQRGIGDVAAFQMTSDVWDYVFALTDELPKSDIPSDTLQAMRREFTYWYPLDLRVSGKDLINNHLVFFLYIHQAFWGEKHPQLLPKAIRINGHLLLNGEKMSKSTGNFLTLTTALQKFGADATRMALADGGDALEDANFEESMANSMVLKLYELKKWIEEVITQTRILQDGENYEEVIRNEGIKTTDTVQRTGALGSWDDLFENEITALTQATADAYDESNYKMAMKSGFFDFTAARDTYRSATRSAGLGMHQACVRRFVQYQALLMNIIAPHWADYIWNEVLEQSKSIQLSTFPSTPSISLSLKATSKYIKQTLARITAADAAQLKRLSKGKTRLDRYDPRLDKRLTIYVTKTWPKWQERYLNMARDMIQGGAITLDVKALASQMAKADMKRAMPFVQALKRRLELGESPDQVFSRTLAFDEAEVLEQMIPILKSNVPKMLDVQVVKMEEDMGDMIEDVTTTSAEPGLPALEFTNI